jgi:hypothetical protein
MMDSLAQLKYLIDQIPDPLLRQHFRNWIHDHVELVENIQRIGKIVVDSYRGNKEDLIRHEEVKLCNKIGLRAGQDFVRISRTENREFVVLKGVACVLRYPKPEVVGT